MHNRQTSWTAAEGGLLVKPPCQTKGAYIGSFCGPGVSVRSGLRFLNTSQILEEDAAQHI